MISNLLTYLLSPNAEKIVQTKKTDYVLLVITKVLQITWLLKDPMLSLILVLGEENEFKKAETGNSELKYMSFMCLKYLPWSFPSNQGYHDLNKDIGIWCTGFNNLSVRSNMLDQIIRTELRGPGTIKYI